MGRMEGLDAATQFTLEAAAYVHDIGIKSALEQYGTDAGPYQEELGSAPAREMPYNTIFKTAAGRHICAVMFGLKTDNGDCQ